VWETRDTDRVFVGSLKGRVHFEEGVNRRIILKWIFKGWDAEARVGLIWLMTDR
jgi:hypothetical protein